MEIATDPTPPAAELDFHAAAALFPLLEVESPEFGELIQDIREHGLLQPIVLCDGKILDGRNRYRACQHAGVEPTVGPFIGSTREWLASDFASTAINAPTNVSPYGNLIRQEVPKTLHRC